MKKLFLYFTKGEWLLWLSSMLLITVSFWLCGGTAYLTLVASLLGVTSLIFCAKGNPIGQLLMVVFSLFYGYISYTFSYYGEMLTYLGMSGPMALYALITWIKNPFGGNRAEVTVNRIHRKEVALMLVLTAIVTAVFYGVLKVLGTANLFFSTVSVTTSFAAVYLTARRSPFYALCYAVNDIVLIVLWVLAALTDVSYWSVVICFAVFLVNDLYGFVSWMKRAERQKTAL